MNDYFIMGGIIVAAVVGITIVSYVRFGTNLITKIFVPYLISVGSITFMGFALGKMGLSIGAVGVLVPIAIMIGVTSVIVINMLVIRPLNSILKNIDKVADGTLHVDIDIRSKDEFGLMSDKLRHMVQRLSQMVGNIVEIINNVAAASEQIQSAAQVLSSSASEQSANIEEISSALEEISAAIENTAENSDEAEHIADKSAEIAQKGGDLIGKAITSIQDINTSGQRIGEIVGIISEISFQTNLLALNAAVEAARAGAEGRGFAVVAGEVRNLAQRSGQASKDIGNLIKDSVGKMDTGAVLARNSSESLMSIIESSKNVGSIVTQIAAANKENRAGIGEIAGGMSHLGQLSTETAASSEELAGTANNLGEMMLRLREMMGFFKVDASSFETSAGSRGVRRL